VATKIGVPFFEDGIGSSRPIAAHAPADASSDPILPLPPIISAYGTEDEDDEDEDVAAPSCDDDDDEARIGAAAAFVENVDAVDDLVRIVVAVP